MHSTGTYMPFTPTVSAALRESERTKLRAPRDIQQVVNVKNVFDSGQPLQRVRKREREKERKKIPEIDISVT